MTIRSKLLLSYAFLLGVVLLVGGVALWAVVGWQKAATELKRVYTQAFAAERLRADVYRQIYEATEFLNGDLQSESGFKKIQERVTLILNDLKNRALAPEEIDHLEGLTETQKELVWIADGIFHGQAEGENRSRRNRLANRLDEIAQEVEDDVAILNQYYHNLVQKRLGEARFAGNFSSGVVGFAALMAVAELVLLVFAMQRWLVRPITEVSQATAVISTGNFDQQIHIKSQDEWGKLALAVNQMSVSLRNLKQKLAAQERMAALGELAAYTAHNLRNPLSSIRASAQITLAEHSGNPVLSETCREIVSAVDRLERWIQQLLNYASPITLEPVLTDVNESIKEALALASNSLSQRAIKVQTNLKKDLPRVNLDPLLFEQVIVALISNAAEASDNSGEVTILSDLQPAEDNSSDRAKDHWQVIVRISDRGRGISEDLQRKLFRPFVTTKANGTGIGLAQAKKIIELHHGTIGVSSHVGQGTTVEICLPVRQGSAPMAH